MLSKILPFLSFLSFLFCFHLGSLSAVELKVRIFQGSLDDLTIQNNHVKITRDGVYFAKEQHVFKDMGVEFTTKETIRQSSGEYTGHFIISVKSNRVRIINQLDLENYLPGVLASEISSSWPIESIKAQAVAARSYAWTMIKSREKEAYQMDASTSYQGFAGTVNLPPSLIDAVKKTRGMVLIDKGEPIQAFFNACCGGETERAQDAWAGGEKLSYLQNIKCFYCTTYPKYSWRTNLSLAQIQKSLPVGAFKGEKLLGVKIKNNTRTGRAKTIELIGSGAENEIDASAFRLSVGASTLYSTFFTVRQRGNELEFSGKGYGHGIGLCQWGAKTMAEKGYGYQAILANYYKSVKVETYPKK